MPDLMPTANQPGEKASASRPNSSGSDVDQPH